MDDSRQQRTVLFRKESALLILVHVKWDRVQLWVGLQCCAVLTPYRIVEKAITMSYASKSIRFLCLRTHFSVLSIKPPSRVLENKNDGKFLLRTSNVWLWKSMWFPASIQIVGNNIHETICGIILHVYVYRLSEVIYPYMVGLCRTNVETFYPIQILSLFNDETLVARTYSCHHRSRKCLCARRDTQSQQYIDTITVHVISAQHKHKNLFQMRRYNAHRRWRPIGIHNLHV